MRLRLLSWMRSLDDASLKRVADATRWSYGAADQEGPYSPNKPGCLVCHATGNDYCGAPWWEDADHTQPSQLWDVEERYMDYAKLHGEEHAGIVMQRLARGILARRQIAEMPQESRTLEAVS
jgi:hypothetical protein